MSSKYIVVERGPVGAALLERVDSDERNSDIHYREVATGEYPQMITIARALNTTAA